MNRLLSDVSIKIYDESGNPITEWDDALGWLEDGVEQNELGEWRMTKIYHPYTKEELDKIKIETEKAALAESRRQFTLEEVTALFMQFKLNTIDIPDQISLRMLNFYPSFHNVVGKKVKLGFKFTYNGKLYKTAQGDLLLQAHYPPGPGTESLYTRIDLEHSGAEYDPIPYDGNMALINGKHYIQNGITYLCNRDSINPVFHALKDLVGLYVANK